MKNNNNKKSVTIILNEILKLTNQAKEILEERKMKKRIEIPIHSIIDIITNSSSEIFITDNKRDVKACKEIMSNIIREYCKNTKQKLSNYNNCYEVRKLTKSDLERDEKNMDTKIGDIIIKGTEDNSIPYSLFEYIREVFGVNDIYRE